MLNMTHYGGECPFSLSVKKDVQENGIIGLKKICCWILFTMLMVMVVQPYLSDVLHLLPYNLGDAS